MYEFAASLVRVIDGDTVVLDVDLGFTLWRRGDSYRLSRINAPEMTTEAGHESRAALVLRLADVRALTVTTSKADKYGRWLVELMADGQNVNDWLVANGRAEYHTY